MEVTKQFAIKLFPFSGYRDIYPGGKAVVTRNCWHLLSFRDQEWVNCTFTSHTPPWREQKQILLYVLPNYDALRFM